MKSMRLCLLLILAAVLLPLALGAQDQDKPLLPIFSKGGASEVLAVNIFDTIVYLPVKIDGQDSNAFILDTGNNGPPVLSEKLALALHIPLGEKASTYGAGSKAVDLYAIGQITVAFNGLGFNTVPAIAMPLDLMDPHWGKRKDGLIGSTILSTVITDIDYANKTVRFLDPRRFRPPEAEVIPIEVSDGSLFVRARVFLYGIPQPIEAFMMIDTGVCITNFNAPFAQEHRLPAQSPKCLVTMTGCGIGGESWGVVGRVRAIAIGAVRVENPVVDFSTDKGGALSSGQFSGIIGSDILHRFRVIFDYQGKRMLLQKNAAFAKPFEFDMLGARLIASGDNLDVFKIFYVADKTPARTAGLLAGDEILAIDGRKTAEFNWEMLRAYFQQPGKEVRIEIARGGNKLAVKLTLRCLV